MTNIVTCFSLENEDNASQITPVLNETISNHFIEVHEDAKNFTNVTPRHFTSFVKCFLHIKKTKENYIAENEKKLKVFLFFI